MIDWSADPFIIVLTGAGFLIALVAWRLLLITMPLAILAIAGVGMMVLGMSAVASLLLAASLSRTDPVLAADVQVGGPQGGRRGQLCTLCIWPSPSVWLPAAAVTGSLNGSS